MTHLKIRTPADMLAVVPTVLGFHPEDSLVMLTFGAASPFHARIDHPPVLAHYAEVTKAMLDPVLKHGADRVVFAHYVADEGAARRFSTFIRTAFAAEGVQVIESLHVDAGTFLSLLHGGERQPYDLATNALTAQSVYAGRAPAASRDELMASLVQVEGHVSAEAVQSATVLDEDQLFALVAIHALGGVYLDDETLAAMVAAVQHPTLRDVVMLSMSRENSRDMATFWSEVVRRCPDQYVAHPAALLALAAWLSGHGALAWCALDRSDEQAALHEIVSTLLTQAVSPTAWADMKEMLR